MVHGRAKKEEERARLAEEEDAEGDHDELVEVGQHEHRRRRDVHLRVEPRPRNDGADHARQQEEHDVADAFAWRKETDGVYICAARLEIPEFEEEAGVDLLSDELDEDVDTLGGLVFMLLGRVPVRGEVIEHPAGPVIEVLEADPRRIKRVRVRLAAPAHG